MTRRLTWLGGESWWRRWKEFREVQRVYVMRQHLVSMSLFLVAFEDKRADCIQETDFLHVYPSLSISEFLLIIVLLSSFSSISLRYPLVSPSSGFAESPTPETHTGFNTPVSLQSSALFAQCVDVFIGLRQLLCRLSGNTSTYYSLWASYAILKTCS